MPRRPDPDAVNQLRARLLARVHHEQGGNVVTHEETPRRNRALDLMLPALIVASLFVGAGAMLAQHFADREAAKFARDAAAELTRVREAGEQRAAHLEALIDTERKTHARDSGERHDHFLAFTRNASRVRNDLEALLAGSRRANDACSGRIARISDDYAGLDELLAESVSVIREDKAQTP